MPTVRKPIAYRVYAVDGQTGHRERLIVDRLVVELRPGVEVEVELRPHPNFKGQLILFCPSQEQMVPRYKAGMVDSFAVMFGSENFLHVIVETRTNSTRPKKPNPSRKGRPPGVRSR